MTSRASKTYPSMLPLAPGDIATNSSGLPAKRQPEQPRFFRRYSPVARPAIALVITSVLLLFSASAGSAQSTTFVDVASRPNLTQSHADALRLYWAFFDREPDVAGAEYWIAQVDRCATLLDISWSFEVSAEFQATYGQPTHEAFIDLVYANVLDRRPDASGRAYWLDLLRSGRLTKAETVLYFSLSSEFRTMRPLASDGRPDRPCSPPAPMPEPEAGPAPTSRCHTAYTSPCLPVVDDLDCGDIAQRVMVARIGVDPYRLDGDSDGIGCEAY